MINLIELKRSTESAVLPAGKKVNAPTRYTHSPLEDIIELCIPSNNTTGRVLNFLEALGKWAQLKIQAGAPTELGDDLEPIIESISETKAFINLSLKDSNSISSLIEKIRKSGKISATDAAKFLSLNHTYS